MSPVDNYGNVPDNFIGSATTRKIKQANYSAKSLMYNSGDVLAQLTGQAKEKGG